MRGTTTVGTRPSYWEEANSPAKQNSPTLTEITTQKNSKLHTVHDIREHAHDSLTGVGLLGELIRQCGVVWLVPGGAALADQTGQRDQVSLAVDAHGLVLRGNLALRAMTRARPSLSDAPFATTLRVPQTPGGQYKS